VTIRLSINNKVTADTDTVSQTLNLADFSAFFRHGSSTLAGVSI